MAYLFQLPSKRTVTRSVSKFASNAGFNETSFFVIKNIVEALSHSEKLCVLMVDKSSLKSSLYHDAARDHLVGLEDCADSTCSGMLAKSALVLMVCYIAHNWKQPVAYYLVSESCSFN